MKIEVESLSLRELDSLLAAAARRKQQLARRRSITAVRRDLIAFAMSQGYAIDELLDARSEPSNAKPRRRGKRVKVAVKYRDPQNPRNTWTGRGSMPKWLAAKTARGHSIADFLIPGLAMPTAKKVASIGRKSLIKRDREASGEAAS